MRHYDIKKFIDFDGIFEALFQEIKPDLIKYSPESDTYRRVLEFYCVKEEYILELEECDIDDKTVRWVFLRNNNDSNESNPDSTFSAYAIIYDFILEEFTTCDYES